MQQYLYSNFTYGLKNYQSEIDFQLNRFSLPNLLPGHNTVDVSAHRFDAPLVVCYKWAEGPGWEQPRCERRTLRQDERFELEVAGPHYPRMQELSLAVE